MLETVLLDFTIMVQIVYSVEMVQMVRTHQMELNHVKTVPLQIFGIIPKLHVKTALLVSCITIQA